MKKLILFISTFLILFGAYALFYSFSSKAMHLTALGDSITYGTGDSSKKGYIKRVEKKLEEKRGFPVILNNFGIPQYTTENVLSLMKETKIKKQVKKADYLVLYIGTNDFRKSAQYEFSQPNIKKIEQGKRNYSKNLNTILQRIRNQNSTAPIMVLGLYHPYSEYENYEEIHRLIMDWNTEIVDVVDNIDKTHFIPTLDLFQNKPKEKYFSDSLHLNPSGYELLADRVTDAILLLEANKGTY